MKLIMRLIATMLLCNFVTGCGALQGFADDKSYGVSAAQLTPVLVDAALTAGTTTDKKPIWRLLDDSADSCGAFVNGLVAAETGTSTSLDMATTVFSALGTALTPISTVHALNAAATITGGWRTAISSDVFARASVGNFAQAIQSTYYQSMQDYVAKLQAAQTIDSGAEVAKIRSIHAQCSLASAESSISAALQPSGSESATTVDVMMTVSGSVKTTEDVELAAIWTSGPSGGISKKYAAKTTDTPATIAAGLLSAVNNDTTLKAAKIVALASTSPASIILRSPSVLAVSWSGPKAKGQTITLTFGVPSQTDQKFVAAVGTPGAQTSVVVPGTKP